MPSVSQFLPLKFSGLLICMRTVGWLYLARLCRSYQAYVQLHVSFFLGLRTGEQRWLSGGRHSQVDSRSWGESKEEEGKLFRLFKASAGNIIIITKILLGCAIGCVCSYSKGITQPHLKSVRWGRMLYLLEAVAKAKKG